jgi:predicted RecB family nuclease
MPQERNDTINPKLVTSRLFADYLECPMKCFLRATGAPGGENIIAAAKEKRTESYRREAIIQRFGGSNAVLDRMIRSQCFEARVHIVQPLRPKASSPTLIHFVPTNKVTRNDKLLATFNAMVLLKCQRGEIDSARIVHGAHWTMCSVKTPTLAREVGKAIQSINTSCRPILRPTLFSTVTVRNASFRTTAERGQIEKNDLSLLSGLTARETLRLNNKGIFTVHQLSYTFRPRRRPKRLATRNEKYHHSIRALAIREGKIHVVGQPELRFEGTPVFIDVEGIPDRHLFYLIGIRFEQRGAIVRQHFWADKPSDEANIWRAFLDCLSEIENPFLVHYGAFETRS